MTVATPANDSARALYEAMIGALGPAATGWTGTLELPSARPGTSVLVLGAGIGGLTAAYELSRRGFTVTVLEAQDRAGGRNRTARSGDELVEIGPSGSPVVTHRCSFDGDLYFNLGPGRIPYHHRRVLNYCRDLGVALEPYVMETTANLVRTSTAVPARWHNRRVANDVRGHLAALLFRYLAGDDALSEDLRDLLVVFGDLSPDGEYLGSTRTGYELDDNGFPVPAPPLDFATLVTSRFWSSFYQPIEYLWQATMFQPVGGMDAIVTAFAEEITRRYGPIIRLGAAVTAITLPDEGGVVVEYVQDGTTHRQAADHCVSSIPLPVLRDLELSSFSPDFIDAINAVGFAPTCKVGWQANARFWENDQNAIYGGISWTDHTITQMWYPSGDLGSARGMVTGAYNFASNAEYLGDLKPDRRLEEACTGAIELHPEFQDPDIVPPDRGVSIAWHKVPYQLGGWAGWNPADPDHMTAYRTLLEPQGGDRFYVLGDQASPLPGWQEGAMMSAHYVAGQILGTIPLTVPAIVEVPDSVALTQGRR